MACSRGCCATPAEHYKSIAVANLEARKAGKTTVDVHENGGRVTHTVEVRESWNDRQDVTVKPQTLSKRLV